jgi:hypothetical protein
MKYNSWIIVAVCAWAATAQAQDQREDAKWATNVCGECHAIARSQFRSPNGRVPTFVELANTPGMSSGKTLLLTF